ncbi:hypothetical protein L6164_018546 [Bauhinia variegata]|uniref:Uncharacterized protein n=1 Tax=Bauhinia variegata TaxID=167791 RepID=A0ACB9NCX9_BAUVA|nr:hypothetical protein L6164_018546 [Bauhinia variegata]
MGGGGAMRTAAKVAGFGLAANGMRGVPLVPPAEQSVGKASRPVSAVLSSQGGTRAAEVAPLHTAASWEMDDWEFADDNELVVQAGEPMPRVVFGGVPSFREAKAATSELKDAIDQVYLSSNSTEGSSAVSKGTVLSLNNSELDTKSCVIEAVSTPSVPNHALQAFKFLSGSPEVQTVVASIACDPNVWNAVMQNPELNDFMQSQKRTVANLHVEESPEKMEYLSDSDDESVKSVDSRNGFDFMDALQNIKFTVAEMLSDVSNYFQSIFGFSAAEKSSSDANGGDEKASLGDQMILGGTFFGLAVLVAMVVILKRG